MSKKTIQLDDNLYQYLLGVSLREHEALKSLRDETLNLSGSQMQISPDQGQFMAFLVRAIRANKILEIGTGSGYQAAVLCEMGMKLYTIERIKELFRKTSVFLPSINYRPKKMIYGDGYRGYIDESPYDSIIVTAGASEIPQSLISQLKIGGRMVIPVGDQVQQMKLVIKTSESDYELHNFGDFQFVPMLKDKN